MTKCYVKLSHDATADFFFAFRHYRPSSISTCPLKPFLFWPKSRDKVKQSQNWYMCLQWLSTKTQKVGWGDLSNLLF